MGNIKRLRAGEGFDLLRWFSVVSLAAAVCVSVALAALLDRHVGEQLLRHDAELSRQFVQGLVDTRQMARAFEASGLQPNPEIDRVFGALTDMPDVLRANVYAPDGRMLWSSDAALIGKRFDDNHELADALRGEVTIERGSVEPDAALDKLEHADLAPNETHFVENYLPVVAVRGGAPVAVVELYRVPRSLNATLRASTLLVWFGTLAGGVLIYLATLRLVRKASRLMHEQRSRLVDAETLAVVGELSASVAHSIRNPLSSIRTSAELGKEIGTMAEDVADDAIRQVDRIEQLVRTLLACAHAPSQIHGSADVRQTLHEALERFRPSFQAQGKAIDVQLADTLPPVHGQSILIAQVANTLLSNALEATSAGDSVRLSARRDGNQVVVEVSDSGPGIAAERLASLFQPFQTTKRNGLGMGLALAKRTLERIGGSIELRSQPGQTCAIVSLEVTQAG